MFHHEQKERNVISLSSRCFDLLTFCKTASFLLLIQLFAYAAEAVVGYALTVKLRIITSLVFKRFSAPPDHKAGTRQPPLNTHRIMLFIFIFCASNLIFLPEFRVFSVDTAHTASVIQTDVGKGWQAFPNVTRTHLRFVKWWATSPVRTSFHGCRVHVEKEKF